MRSSDDIWKAGGGETAFSFKDGMRTILFNNQRKRSKTDCYSWIKLSVNKFAYIQDLFRFIYIYLISDYHNYINNKKY